MSEKTLAQVKNYYGKVLTSSDDLQTNACCTADAMPAYLQPIMAQLHDEVVNKFYGCGSPLPLAVKGANVLDLGCGSGRDCYILSKLVGEEGTVTGIDMTAEQLAVAVEHQQYHADKFGYSQSNIHFKQGYIEDLAAAEIESNSMDLVVSNCVLNLSPAKDRVFSEIFRVLKPGGELYFSDVFVDRRTPKAWAEDPVLLGECLGGALYIEDFRRLLADLGCHDYRVTAQRQLTLENQQIIERVGETRFYSMTIRAFKLSLEDRYEDYGQQACYQGSITESPDSFDLDAENHFPLGKFVPVCRNTSAMLGQTRYRAHFEIKGEGKTHFGLFDCATDKVTSGCC